MACGTRPATSPRLERASRGDLIGLSRWRLGAFVGLAWASAGVQSDRKPSLPSSGSASTSSSRRRGARGLEGRRSGRPLPSCG